MTASGYTPWQERALWDGLVKMYKVHILKCTLYIVTFHLTKTRALTFEIFFKEGYVSAVGVSNYGPKTLRKVHAYLRDQGVPLAANQIQYSLLSRTVGSEVKEVV